MSFLDSFLSHSNLIQRMGDHKSAETGRLTPNASPSKLSNAHQASPNDRRKAAKHKTLCQYLDDDEQQHDSDCPPQESLQATKFYSINDAPVEDISIEFFYKPHTLTLLFVGIAWVLYSAFTRNADANLENNLWAAAKVIAFFFMIISVIAFPNGPFIRPHPVIWRMVFGISVLYLMALLFILFQDYSTIKSIMYWFFPDLRTFSIDLEKVGWSPECYLTKVAFKAVLRTRLLISLSLSLSLRLFRNMA